MSVPCQPAEDKKRGVLIVESPGAHIAVSPDIFRACTFTEVPNVLFPEEYRGSGLSR